MVKADLLEEIRCVEAFYVEKSPGLQSADVVSLTGRPFREFQGRDPKRFKDRVEIVLIVLGGRQRVFVPSIHVLAKRLVNVLTCLA